MCAHIGQNRHIYPPSIFRIHFDSWHPSPFCAGSSWGCYREKFFLILFFLVSPILFLLVFYFFIFSDFRLVYPILGFWLNSFSEYLRFNSFIFARHYLDYDFWPRFWFSTRIFYFLDSFLLASISTCFSIVDSTFWLFNSLSLWLFCLL